jgi:hypothetical protein
VSRSADNSANAPALATNGIGLAVAGIFCVPDEGLVDALELLGVVEPDEVAGSAELVGAVDASTGF